MNISAVHQSLRRLPHCFPTHTYRIEGLEADEHQFNCSLIRHKGKLVLAWRKKLHESEVWISLLDENFRATSNTRLEFPPGDENWLSTEDPRLFEFDHRLFCEYVGFNGQEIRICVAELDDKFRLIDNWFPKYNKSQKMEKNWGFFESGGDLHCVYSIQPHRVLKFKGKVAVDEIDSQMELPWTHGLIRGGAPPVLHEGVWWSFFHGTILPGGPGQLRKYSVGCYSFENCPPFRPLAITPRPILFPDPAMQPTLGTHHVVFPAGAVFEEGRWLLSYGNYHRWCEIAQFDHKRLKRAMVSVTTTAEN